MAANAKDPGIEDIYKPGAKRLVFMVINKEFDKHSTRRAGKDCEYNVFSEHFGFESCNSAYETDKKAHFLENATKKELEEELEHVKKKLQNKNISCLAVIVSSHGKEMVYQNKDGSPMHREHDIICKDGGLYSTLEMFEKFKNENIPVIYVIQACRDIMNIAIDGTPATRSQDTSTDRVDKGVEIKLVDGVSDVEDSVNGESNSEKLEATYSDEADEGSIPFPNTSKDSRSGGEKQMEIPVCVPNTCVLFSCSEGKTSYVKPSIGSWLLSSMNNAVEEMKTNKETEISLFTLFTRVNRKMSVMETDKKRLKSASCFVHRMSSEMILKLKQPSEQENIN